MRNEFKIVLELEELNLILAALGERPYAQVYQLIAKIQQQAQTQMQATEDDEGATQ